MFTSLLHKLKKLKILEVILIGWIFIAAINLRTQYFDQRSKDINSDEAAVIDLLSDVNPYTATIKSFESTGDPNNHGFAYLPGMLYLRTLLFLLSKQVAVSHIVLWKIPVLLADLGVGIFLLAKTKNQNIFVKLIALSMWFFNPYAYFRGGYTYIDPFSVFFMMCSLHFLNKNNALSGACYATAIAIKTFPYLIFPVFLLKLWPNTKKQLKAKEKWHRTGLARFLIYALSIALIISLPFMGSLDDFVTYITGALLVHSNRFVQGRPFLYYISYYGKIEFFRIIPFSTYTLLASFAGWPLMVLLYLKKPKVSKYVLALIPFLTFYLFTPVFNRTYMIWFTPIFVLATMEFLKSKYKSLFYVVNISFYIFYSWYLLQWEDGFHIWHP